jgi:hypothetical protein
VHPPRADDDSGADASLSRREAEFQFAAAKVDVGLSKEKYEKLAILSHLFLPALQWSEDK